MSRTSGLSVASAGFAAFSLFLKLVLAAGVGVCGIDLIGSNKAAVVSVIELPFALALGLLFQGEVITPSQWLGAAFILSAILATHRFAARTTS